MTNPDQGERLRARLSRLDEAVPGRPLRFRNGRTGSERARSYQTQATRFA